MEFEAMYNESERIYNEEYSTGEYCHEQSFKWGFREGFDFAKNVMIERACKWIKKEILDDYQGVIWGNIVEDFRKAMEE